MSTYVCFQIEKLNPSAMNPSSDPRNLIHLVPKFRPGTGADFAGWSFQMEMFLEASEATPESKLATIMSVIPTAFFSKTFKGKYEEISEVPMWSRCDEILNRMRNILQKIPKTKKSVWIYFLRKILELIRSK